MRGRGGQVAGQPRVNRAEPRELARAIGQAGQGGQRDGQRDLAGEPGGGRAGRGGSAGLAPAGGCEGGSLCPAAGRGRRGRGARPCRRPARPASAPCAQAVIRWSAASTSSGGSSRPISAALPESSAHRSTRANPPRSPALPRLLGGGLDDRAGDRGPQRPRGQAGGPVQDLLLGGAGLIGVQERGGAGDDLRLIPGDRPSSSAAAVPGRWVSRVWARPIRLSARSRDSPSAQATSSAVNS